MDPFSVLQECFTENLVNGRKLIYVNCVYLPRLGITNFKDMQVTRNHYCNESFNS